MVSIIALTVWAGGAYYLYKILRANEFSRITSFLTSVMWPFMLGAKIVEWVNKD